MTVYWVNWAMNIQKCWHFHSFYPARLRERALETDRPGFKAWLRACTAGHPVGLELAELHAWEAGCRPHSVLWRLGDDVRDRCSQYPHVLPGSPLSAPSTSRKATAGAVKLAFGTYSFQNVTTKKPIFKNLNACLFFFARPLP